LLKVTSTPPFSAPARPRPFWPLYLSALQDALVTKFQERVAGLKMPPSAKTVFDEELEKLQVRGADRRCGTQTCIRGLARACWAQ